MLRGIYCATRLEIGQVAGVFLQFKSTVESWQFAIQMTNVVNVHVRQVNITHNAPKHCDITQKT